MGVLSACPPRSCIPLEETIRRALDELPETLDETYARTLEEIGKKKWKYAQLIFQCIAAASRPLLVSELAEFLAFDFEAGSMPTLLADRRLEDPAHTVLSVCSSLLVIVEPGSGSPVVQFAHFSVKEYLMSVQLAEAKDTISRYHISMSAAHTIVARACLGVLLHLDDNVTKDSLEKFPLAEYAAEHWVEHARFEDVSLTVQDGMKRLFDPSNSYLSIWVWLCDPKDTTNQSERSERPGKASATPLHYAALCGICDVVKFLILERSQDVNARGFDTKETPLLVASRNGHADVARLLLEHGADADARYGDNDSNPTPLLLATENGYVEVARILLEYHADTEARAILGWSPLTVASLFVQVEIARALLEHGADVNSKDTSNKTPLYYAHREVVARLLIEYGADVNAVDIDGRTPLHLASERGNPGAAWAILEQGADPNARDASNATPLHLTSYTKYVANGEAGPLIVHLLIHFGSDIHARDDEGRTPFMRATEQGFDSLIQVLLEYGAEDHRM